MAKHSGNPEVSRKMGVSALVTFLLSVLGFYLGDRYGEAIASQPGQFFQIPFGQACILQIFFSFQGKDPGKPFSLVLFGSF